MADRITTPRGTVTITPGGKAELRWDVSFRPRWQGRYNMAQAYLDSEVLRLCEPYTPLLTGMLVKSGTLGTVIGSGLVQWIAPYARRQYYKGRAPGTSVFGGLRGRYWFERMKAVSKNPLVKRARVIAGGGPH